MRILDTRWTPPSKTPRRCWRFFRAHNCPSGDRRAPCLRPSCRPATATGTAGVHKKPPRRSGAEAGAGCPSRATSTCMTYSLTLAAIADAIAELEASANDSAEARAWLALLRAVLDQDDDA